jgi:charged multivesicular body protein 1
MVTTVQGMGHVMKSMKVEQIAATMTDFEKQFEDMDVRSGYMEETMESTTSMATPPEQVDNLIQMVADEAGLQWQAKLDTPTLGKPQQISTGGQKGKKIVLTSYIMLC